MRAGYMIAILAIAIPVVGAKLILVSPKNAGAMISQVGLDVHQMHKDSNVEKKVLL